MSSPSLDAHDLAFEALLQIARPTATALERVDRLVADERTVMDPLRAAFNPALNAGVLGLGRFGYAVQEVGAAWQLIPHIRRVSTHQQESSNVFLWALGDRYVLRIKRDPVDGVAEGTQRLFAQLPDVDRCTTVLLTWDIDLAGRIAAARFVCVDEPRWTISLARLLAHDAAAIVALPSTGRRGPIVRSRITQDDTKRDDS